MPLLAPKSRADPCSFLIKGGRIDHKVYVKSHPNGVPEIRPCVQTRAVTERNYHFPEAGSEACSETYPERE